MKTCMTERSDHEEHVRINMFSVEIYSLGFVQEHVSEITTQKLLKNNKIRKN